MIVNNKKLRTVILLALSVFVCLSISSSLAQSISIKALEQVPIDSIGLINEQNNGLPQNMWKNVSYDYASNLLQELPTRSPSPVIQELMRMVLLTESTPPQNTESGKLLAIRLKKLMALGEYNAVGNLITMIPTSRFSEEFARIEIDNFLLSQERSKACEKGKLYLEIYGDIYWQKINLYCLALEGKKDEVELGLTLMEEQGNNYELECCNLSLDEALTTIAKRENLKEQLSGFFSSGEYPKDLYKISDNKFSISPLEFAILQTSQVPFTESTIRMSNPGIQRVIALYSNSSLDMRIYAAELSVGSGAVTMQELRDIYYMHKWSGDGGHDKKAKGSLPLIRAELFQIIDQSQIPLKHDLENLKNRYKESNLQNTFPFAVAHIFKKLSADMYNRTDLISIADIAIESLLASGNQNEANIWYRMVEIYEEKNEEANRIVKIVRPLTRGTVPIAPSWDPKYADDWWTTYANGDIKKKSTIASRLYSVVQAYRHQLPPFYWERINKYYQTEENGYKYPQANIVGTLKSSAEQRNIAETILLVCSIAGEYPLYQIPENIVANLTRALLFIGLKKQAQILSMESVVNHAQY